MLKKISCSEVFELKNTIFLDTRSPKEYELDHIKNAVNLPILDNQERHEIGYLYKQVSIEQAYKKGIEYYSQKIPQIIQTVEKYKNKKMIVYCARGGMRSKAITQLLSSYQFDVYQLEGGYKAFRNYLLKKLNNFQLKPKIYVFWGLTCSGKTDLLKQFSHFLDLEGLAQHRGSLYGSINLKPNSQKKFENLLLQHLEYLNHQKYIFIEGESRKIGNVQIPSFLYKKMLKGTNVLVERSIDIRIKEMIKEYFQNQKAVEEIIKITEKLWKVISKIKKEKLLRYLKNKKFKEAGKIFLEDYYDPLYYHTIKKKEYLFKINNDNLTKAKKEIENHLKKLK